MAAPISFDAALALIGEVAPLGCETVPLADAAGRTLAADLIARGQAPRSAVSTMDGYAVVDAATEPGEWLEVIGESRAGAWWRGTVGPGQAVRVFTGAGVPEGATRVIIQEHAERDGARVRFTPAYGPATYIRAAGSDFAAEAMVLPAGTRLTPRILVAAGAADRAEVTVGRIPRVAILATGDELAAPGEAHAWPDAIPETIGLGVAALAQSAGAEIVVRAICPDDLARLTALAGELLERSNLVVVTGGASVGERDFAKASFAAHALALAFEKVAIKPGRPVWFGRCADALVLGLPGNPTSALVTAALFLRPLLARLQGGDAAHQWRTLPLAASLPAADERETFVRARWDDAGLVPLGNQDSGAQSPLTQADWLIRCPAHQPALAARTMVSALAF
ncbi:molybdopterin molybdenumtransferase MoeA [Tsuneonella deserti]|uniref:Molybdopterin molybdenumtransferase n=1 Tax=Tsuneonella deserti TaxID=2035528 RepID=A0ABQ1RZM6_9SPHN|nr:molybdopterin molybdotransferase MoeA [Tsuneonella deserti]GGD86391.1 molybdopterin molybdenumtransferase MoeA [Tsuneonella deserti]